MLEALDVKHLVWLQTASNRCENVFPYPSAQTRQRTWMAGNNVFQVRKWTQEERFLNLFQCGNVSTQDASRCLQRAHKLTWGVILFQLITALHQLPTKDHPHMFWTQSNLTWSCNKPFFFGGPLIPFVGFLPRVSNPGWIPSLACFITCLQWIY